MERKTLDLHSNGVGRSGSVIELSVLFLFVGLGSKKIMLSQFLAKNSPAKVLLIHQSQDMWEARSVTG